MNVFLNKLIHLIEFLRFFWIYSQFSRTNPIFWEVSRIIFTSFNYFIWTSYAQSISDILSQNLKVKFLFFYLSFLLSFPFFSISLFFPNVSSFFPFRAKFIPFLQPIPTWVRVRPTPRPSREPSARVRGALALRSALLLLWRDKSCNIILVCGFWRC